MLSRLHRRGVATPDCCSHAPPAARDVCAAPLAPGHPREGGQALDRSAAANALPLEAALLHLDTDFELHRLSHRPGDAAVSRPTTRRVLVVHLSSLVEGRSRARSFEKAEVELEHNHRAAPPGRLAKPASRRRRRAACSDSVVPITSRSRGLAPAATRTRERCALACPARIGRRASRRVRPGALRGTRQ